MERHNDQLKHDDPVAWARAETIAFSKRKVKFYGALVLVNLVVLALLSKGMPGHFLWPYLGPISGITLVCLAAVAGFYALALIDEYRYRRKPRR
jgi:protein-S-isoprenylcysteine O-methyltransferase Ste14